jgi:hypothetical protein
MREESRYNPYLNENVTIVATHDREGVEIDCGAKKAKVNNTTESAQELEYGK